jgi:hypothetical protein
MGLVVSVEISVKFGSLVVTISSYELVTGVLLGEVVVMSSDEVRDVVRCAKCAQEFWGVLIVVECAVRVMYFCDAFIAR